MIETAREREKEKEQGKGEGEQRQSFFSGNAMTNGLSERLTPFLSLALSLCLWLRLALCATAVGATGDAYRRDEIFR